MTRRTELPATLRRVPFRASAAAAAGVSLGRLRATDLARPYRDVRVPASMERDLHTRCRALLTVRPDVVFSHTTAALLMGIPLPLSSATAPELHVSVFGPARSPRIDGVIAHQLHPVPDSTWSLRGLPITSPPLTWTHLASMLTVPNLVAAGDYLLTGSRPLAAVAEITESALAHRGFRGARARASALPLLRRGPRSRPESLGRLLYVTAGLPEPELNGNIFDQSGRFVAMSDLVWRAYRVANEYEGKHHQDGPQFRKDILRRERVEDAGWRLSRFTSDDLFLRPAETVVRMANRLNLFLVPSDIRAAVALSRTFGR